MSDTRSSDALPNKAQALFMAGRLDEAAALYRQRLQEKPQDIEANQALGFIYFQARQFELAQYFAGEALKLDPTYLDGFRLRGMALMQLGRVTPALQCFSQGLALRPVRGRFAQRLSTTQNLYSITLARRLFRGTLLLGIQSKKQNARQPHSQGGRRSRPINWSTSRRGRTRAHSPSRTSTSGASARVL